MTLSADITYLMAVHTKLELLAFETLTGYSHIMTWYEPTWISGLFGNEKQYVYSEATVQMFQRHFLYIYTSFHVLGSEEEVKVNA